MKKKIFVVIFLALFLFSFVLAQEEFDTEPYERNVEKIEEVKDKLPFDSDTGAFDPSRLNKSLAEERIDEINKWIEENAEWLKLVFTMVPEISFKFAFVLYFWMFFFVLFVLNSEIFLFFNYTFTEKIGQYSQAEKYTRLIGIGGFVVLVALRIIYHIGNFFYNFWRIVWNYVLPLGIIAIVIAIIVLAVLAILAPMVFLMFVKWFKKKKERKEKEQESLDRKVLHIVTEGITEKE